MRPMQDADGMARVGALDAAHFQPTRIGHHITPGNLRIVICEMFAIPSEQASLRRQSSNPQE
jgi:hypothetical protein